MIGDDELEDRIRGVLARAPRVAACYLFGSRARGEARAGSDVDVAILFEDDPTDPFEGLGVDLAIELEADLRLPVDVVVLNRAPAVLVHRVLRDGRLLLERSRPLRVRFEVDARNRYFDLLPLIETYRQAAS